MHASLHQLGLVAHTHEFWYILGGCMPERKELSFKYTQLTYLCETSILSGDITTQWYYHLEFSVFVAHSGTEKKNIYISNSN